MRLKLKYEAPASNTSGLAARPDYSEADFVGGGKMVHQP